MAEEIKLINGSWVQTLATILNSINEQLQNTEIDDIIRRIDATIADEDILDLLNRVVLIISNTQSDISLLKLQNNVLNQKLDILQSIVNELLQKRMLVVREVVIREPPKLEYKKNTGVRLPYTQIEKKIESDETFVIDQTLTSGYNEQVVELEWWGYRYLNGSWLINGNRRRLITEDMELLKKYGII